MINSIAKSISLKNKKNNQDFSLIQEVFKNSLLNLFIFDRKGRVLVASNALCNMLNYKASDLIFKKVDFIMEEKFSNKEMKELLRSEINNSFKKLIFSDDSRKPFLLYTSVMKDYGEVNFLSLVFSSNIGPNF
ncbi:MAG: PAS domain S-box protein [Leptospiraceae bacterium]|nr:PAS domain S-box protein [Leptospiraceae bacterium]